MYKINFTANPSLVKLHLVYYIMPKQLRFVSTYGLVLFIHISNDLYYSTE